MYVCSDHYLSRTRVALAVWVEEPVNFALRSKPVLPLLAGGKSARLRITVCRFRNQGVPHLGRI